MNPRHGFVLVAALWIVVALSAASAHLAANARNSRQLAWSRVSLIRAQAAIESCVKLAEESTSQELAGTSENARDAVDPWTRLLGKTEQVRIDDQTWCNYRFDDTDNRFNAISTADSTINKYLRSLGDSVGNGAELRNLRESLARISSHSMLQFERAARTVWSSEAVRGLTVRGTGRVNVHAAELDVIAALPGMNARIAQAVGDLRAKGRINRVQDIVPMLSLGDQESVLTAPALDGLVSYETVNLETTVTAGVSDNVVICRAHVGFARTATRGQIIWREDEC